MQKWKSEIVRPATKKIIVSNLLPGAPAPFKFFCPVIVSRHILNDLIKIITIVKQKSSI
jgi:hypothetical protein